MNYAFSILGAFGTLPLIVYWSHRGLRQLTFGGKVNAEGKNPDPTDKYTYIALLLVAPVVLGILGAATLSSGAVFGQLGIFSEVIRIVTSVLYATFAGTPGMATLLRNIFNTLQPRFFSKANKRFLLLEEGKKEEVINYSEEKRRKNIPKLTFFPKKKKVKVITK